MTGNSLKAVTRMMRKGEEVNYESAQQWQVGICYSTKKGTMRSRGPSFAAGEGKKNLLKEWGLGGLICKRGTHLLKKNPRYCGGDQIIIEKFQLPRGGERRDDSLAFRGVEGRKPDS